MRWYQLIGRILVGGVFAYVAAKGLTEPGAASDAVISATFPHTEYVAAAVFVLFGMGGASVVFGLASRWGLRMLALALTLCIASRAFAPAGADLMLAWSIGLLGAIIALMALPAPWPMSVDEWIANDDNHWGWPWNGARVRALVNVVRRSTAPLRTAARKLTGTAPSYTATAQSERWGRELVVHRTVRVVGGGKVLIRSVRGYVQAGGLE